MVNLLRWAVRLAGLGALILGILIWRGIFTGLKIHMTLGAVVVGVLAILAVYAIAARVRIPLAVVSLIWAGATVDLALRQNGIHLLMGVCAIGMAEALGGAITRGKTSLV